MSSAVIPMKKHAFSIFHMIAVLCVAMLFCAPLSRAENTQGDANAAAVDILPSITYDNTDTALHTTQDDSTHPPIHLTPDKSELVRLDRDAGSIVIGNPNHINIMAESAKTLVIIPSAPGATHFTVLDTGGDIIMRRHVIVGAPQQNYIKVRRVCAQDAKNCRDTSVFYCPDTCHEINLGDEESESDDSADSATTPDAQKSSNNKTTGNK